MRKFTTLCIDPESRKQLILSDVSFNNACFFLYSKGFTDPEKTTTDYKNNVTTLYFKSPKEQTFYYNENKGILFTD